MRRDMDLIRDLLLFIEKDEGLNGVAYGPVTEEAAKAFDRPEDLVRYHMKLLVDAQYADLMHYMADGEPWIRGLTWNGCEFPGTIRDPEIWRKTKSSLQTVGSFSVGVLKDIATAYIKIKLHELGITAA